MDLSQIFGGGDPQRASRATWVKLAIAIVTMAFALVIFKIAFAWKGTLFMTAFGSFVTVVALSVALYYGVMWYLARRATPPSQS